MRLVIARHGQTKSQTEARYVGDEDGLSDIGLAQASALGLRLRSETVDAVYCSDSRRALETILRAAEHVPLPEVTIEPLLREGSVGRWVSLPTSTRRKEAEIAGVPIWTVQPPGGESWIQISERVGPVLDSIRQRHSEDTVLIVGHGRINTLAIRMLEDQPWSEYPGTQQPHGSITVVEWTAARIEVKLRDDNSFMNPALRTI